MTAGPSLAASLELWAHHQIVARLILFKQGMLVILIDGIISLSPLVDVTRMSVNSFFRCLAKI